MKVETVYISAVDTAKILRRLLKQAFPKTKFSVKTHSYSMGASVDLRWTDGPTQKQVKALMDRFEGADFDAMTDYKASTVREYNGKPVHFGADYIFENRDYSDEFLREVLTILEEARQGCDPEDGFVETTVSVPLSLVPEDIKHQSGGIISFVWRREGDGNENISGNGDYLWTAIYKIAEAISKENPQPVNANNLPSYIRKY